MSVQVYGCNHVAIEGDDIKKAITFYKDVFNLEQLDIGEGDAFFKLGEHQFLGIFEVQKTQPTNVRHFGIMVRDEQPLRFPRPGGQPNPGSRSSRRIVNLAFAIPRSAKDGSRIRGK